MIEHIEPYELTDKIGINKNGIIMKEFIYVIFILIYFKAPDLVYSSFEIKLLKQGKPLEENEKIRMYLELYKLNNFIPGELTIHKELLCKWELCNSIILHNLSLEGIPVIEIKPDKKTIKEKEKELLSHPTPQNLPYLLILYVDKSEMPDYLNEILKGTSNTNLIEVSWVMRVFSSDTLGFVKDSTKEDYERSLKESWESSEPGRADKAKKARLKYLIQSKKEKGEILSLEEEKILKEERERKVTLNETEVNNALINTKNVNIKDKKNVNVIPGKKTENKTDNKNNKLNLNKENKENSNSKKDLIHILPYDKKLPQSSQHTSDYIKNFIHYSYQERTIVFNHNLDQNKKLIIDESVKDLKNTEIIKKTEEFESKRQIEVLESLPLKTDFSQTHKSFYHTTNSFRKEVKDDKETLIKARDLIKNELQIRVDLEKNIQEFIKLANTGIALDIIQLNHATMIYSESLECENNNHSPSNRNQIFSHNVKKMFNLISEKKEEFLRHELKKLTVKDKQNVVKYLEDIESFNWNISEEVIKKLHDLVK